MDTLATGVRAKPIHAMIRVLDEARAVDFYRRAFGMAIVDRFAFESFTLVYLKGADSDFELELTINHGRTEPYAPGEGYGHIAFAVEDLDAAHLRFEHAGFAPAAKKEFQRDGALMAKFFFVEDPDGYRIEVLQRYGRYR
jgi:lactoylglutathione lyase